jgi:hypothetical protein
MIALGAIEKDKIMVARAYNKNVKAKSFQVGDLVWKTILPLRNKDRKFGKRSLSVPWNRGTPYYSKKPCLTPPRGQPRDHQVTSE